MWAQLLIDLLKLHPEISIVLSTPWVRHLGFSRTKAALPESLRKHVIGSTWQYVMAPDSGSALSDSENWYDNATRYEQIARSVMCAGLSGRKWVAIDHSDEAWPLEMKRHLLKTDRKKGLSCPISLAALKARFEAEHYNNNSEYIRDLVRREQECTAEIEASRSLSV